MKAWIITRYDHVKRVAGLFGYLRFSVHTGVACAAHFFSGPFALHQAGRRRQSHHPSAIHRRHARGAGHDRRQDIHRGGEGAAAAAAQFGFAPVLVCVAPCAAILRATDGEEAWAGDGMTGSDLGCVKTRNSRECVELFAQLSSSDRCYQYN